MTLTTLNESFVSFLLAYLLVGVLFAIHIARKDPYVDFKDASGIVAFWPYILLVCLTEK